MNTIKHCKISARRWGGLESDYYAIHDFIDSTKVLCSDGRHRVLHTLWGIKHVVVPMFGDQIVNADGKEVDVKDLCERDHLLVDYANKFIPTLGDFVMAIDEQMVVDLEKKVEWFHSHLSGLPMISELLLSPLAVTGKLKSLLITHNSWFINSIAGRLFSLKPMLMDFSLSPFDVFGSMNFEPWMDNALAYPPSAEKMKAFENSATTSFII
ncbi:hypothetical protein [Pleionea sp. CnH1-48]|uniref:DUF6915 family protein n=1 Tax=Pleionea sp. CnH1-48 TaxID=2954494 RepID=UPI00209813DF|nr:hypothetical protein [Pleionea sp. CnH1-48]MCO7224053.1 hypothetical protein [Pleionea sp. CnH1-48]